MNGIKTSLLHGAKPLSSIEIKQFMTWKLIENTPLINIMYSVLNNWCVIIIKDRVHLEFRKKIKNNKMIKTPLDVHVHVLRAKNYNTYFLGVDFF